MKSKKTPSKSLSKLQAQLFVERLDTLIQLSAKVDDNLERSVRKLLFNSLKESYSNAEILTFSTLDNDLKKVFNASTKAGETALNYGNINKDDKENALEALNKIHNSIKTDATNLFDQCAKETQPEKHLSSHSGFLKRTTGGMKRLIANHPVTSSVLLAGSIGGGGYAGYEQLPHGYSITKRDAVDHKKYHSIVQFSPDTDLGATALLHPQGEGGNSAFDSQDYDTVVVALGPDLFSVETQKLKERLEKAGVRKVVILGDGEEKSFDPQHVVDAVKQSQGPVLCMLNGHGYPEETKGPDGRPVQVHTLFHGQYKEGAPSYCQTGKLITEAYKNKLSPGPVDFFIGSCSSRQEDSLFHVEAHPDAHGFIYYSASDKYAVTSDIGKYLNTIGMSKASLNRVGTFIDFLATDFLDSQSLPGIGIGRVGVNFDMEELLDKCKGENFGAKEREQLAYLKKHLSPIIKEYYNPNYRIGSTTVPFEDFFDRTVKAIEEDKVQPDQKGMAGLICFYAKMGYLTKDIVRLDEKIADSQEKIIQGKEPDKFPEYLAEHWKKYYEGQLESFNYRRSSAGR